MLKMLYCSLLFQSHAPPKKNAQQNNLHVDAWATRASIGDAGGGLACAFNRAACNKFALALRCICCPTVFGHDCAHARANLAQIAVRCAKASRDNVNLVIAGLWQNLIGKACAASNFWLACLMWLPLPLQFLFP